MSTQTFVFDTRMPVSDNVSENDPSHPKNVARSMKLLENQAHADTRYDISPPPRMREGFAARPDEYRALHVQIATSILITLLSITFLLRSQGTFIRLLLISVTVLSVHYAVQLLEKRTVYNLSS
jgi:hypothetical protein